MTAQHSSHAVVLGGGVIGLCTARALRASGWAVTLIEAGTAGRSASWAAGGILSPLPPWQAAAPVWALADESIRGYAALCETLHERTGIDPEWTPSGLWVREADDGRAQWLSAQQRVALPRTVTVSGEPSPGHLLPWVAQVRSPRLMQALIADFTANGGVLLQQQGPLHWQRQGATVQAVVTAQGERHAADAFVVAAGAWSAPLLQALGASSPVVPVKGQMLLLRAGAASLPHMVLVGDRYAIPRRDGRVVVGSTLEHTGFEAATTAGAASELLRFAQSLAPTLTAADVEAQWAGLRPMAPEGIPVIGAVPGFNNLWQNTGHYRNGITLAPASAAALRRQLPR